MSNNKKYVALAGGLTCKLVNPFKSCTGSHEDAMRCPASDCECDKYRDFYSNNPAYALTEVMPEGEGFDGVEVWQILYGRTKWVTDVEKRFNTFLEFREYWFDRQTRIAIKPLKAIEPVKALKNLKN